jgi:hypothetical protein
VHAFDFIGAGLAEHSPVLWAHLQAVYCVAVGERAEFCTSPEDATSMWAPLSVAYMELPYLRFRGRLRPMASGGKPSHSGTRLAAARAPTKENL